MNYGEYLHLPELPAAQQPPSEEHDEPLFVIIHQTTELWMKLCISFFPELFSLRTEM